MVSSTRLVWVRNTHAFGAFRTLASLWVPSGQWTAIWPTLKAPHSVFHLTPGPHTLSTLSMIGNGLCPNSVGLFRHLQAE